MAGTEAVLTVDLGAIVANWRALCARHPGGPVAGVVKADAYGLGAGPVARALLAAGCRHFFVAQLTEGQALRAALGPRPMIAVLNGFPPGADGEALLTPVLNGLPNLMGRQGPAILQVDTGMARLGLDAGELDRLAADPGLLRGIDLRYVMTHLACADTPDHPLNAAQAARFRAGLARLPPAPTSIANSSGLFLGPDFASDLARPGCALYGINPTPGAPNPMRPVVSLAAPVLQLRSIGAGESVGYGAAWVARRPTRIATVAAGYADGYLRALSGRATGRIGGVAVPLVGRVSMDLLTFDVTDAPDLRPGDLIGLLDGTLTPDDLATAAGTIGYEILTALGTRYQRVYLPAG